MINGKKTRLQGTYSTGTIGVYDIKQDYHELFTTFFIAKRITKDYTYPQKQAGFLCLAPLAPKYSTFNFMSNLLSKGKITTESFLVQTQEIGYEKYTGQFLVGFDPQSSTFAHQANDYKIYISDVSSNTKINPNQDSELAIVELGSKLVKDVTLQDFDDYSNASQTTQLLYISTGMRGIQIADRLYEIFRDAFIQYNCHPDTSTHRYMCPCDGRSFGGMPALNLQIGTKDSHYAMAPIDYEGFPQIVPELRYAKCMFEVLNSTSTNYPDGYVLGRTFMTKYNVAFYIDRSGGEANLSWKVSVKK